MRNNVKNNKIWGIHTTEYYAAIKKELLIHTTTWIDLKGIMLRENGQCERGYTERFHLYYMLKKAKR